MERKIPWPPYLRGEAAKKKTTAASSRSSARTWAMGKGYAAQDGEHCRNNPNLEHVFAIHRSTSFIMEMVVRLGLMVGRYVQPETAAKTNSELVATFLLEETYGVILQAFCVLRHSTFGRIPSIGKRSAVHRTRL
jgi:hypothetical protein